MFAAPPRFVISLRRISVAAVAVCLVGALAALVPAGAVSAQSSGVALPPQSQGSCAGEDPIVVGSDAGAQSDIYAAAMLAGVIGSDCIVLAGPRDEPMPADQQARLAAANAGGFVVGGAAAVPPEKFAGRTMTSLSGPDRWATARRVGQHAAGVTPDASATQDVPPRINGVAVPPQSQGSCAGEDPIVVGSDAGAQSDIYAAAMLAGVIGSDCIVLAGPRDEPMPADQQARLAAANAGGFVVGGTAAVPPVKIAGRSMRRLSGADRWATARLVGQRAAGDTTVGTPTDQEAIEELFAEAAAQRAEIVDELTRQIRAGNYGIGEDNVLRGPAGFRINLDDCPSGWSDTTGITDAEIRIGYSLAQSGFLSDYGLIGTGMANYFEWVNANDPVASRQIVLISKDDAYIAQRTIDNVDALIKSENVLSITTLGTPNTLATYDRINDECIPHPFAQSGHPAWGDPVAHPWTTGLQMAYNTEAILWGTWIEKNLTGKLPVSVAAIVMDNDFGLAYETAFEKWVEAHPEVVSSFTAVRHDPAAPSLAAEMRAVAGANPDVYISMTAGSPCLLAIQEAASSGLTASITANSGAMFTASVCKGIDQFLRPAGNAADGWLIVGGGAKDSTDEHYADEPFNEFVNENLEDADLDPEDSLHGTGYLFAYPYVEALRIAAELPDGITRTNLILAVRSLDIDHPMYLDGIRFTLSGNSDAYPIEGSDISQYDSGSETWGTPTEIIGIDGQTPNCSWSFVIQRCASLTEERLTTLAAHFSVDADEEDNAASVSARAHRAGEEAIEGSLKPGYWQITADSLCLYYDRDLEDWRLPTRRGSGWIGVNGNGAEVDSATRIRLEHGDTVQLATYGGGASGPYRCELNWVADLD